MLKFKISRFPTCTTNRELCTTKSDRLGDKTRFQPKSLKIQLFPSILWRAGPETMPKLLISRRGFGQKNEGSARPNLTDLVTKQGFTFVQLPFFTRPAIYMLGESFWESPVGGNELTKILFTFLFSPMIDQHINLFSSAR